MSAVPVLEELTRLGVRLWAEGDRLRYDAPAGVMTAERVAAVRENKLLLLAELTAPPAPRPWWDPEALRERHRARARALLEELDAMPQLSRDDVLLRDYLRSTWCGRE